MLTERRLGCIIEMNLKQSNDTERGIIKVNKKKPKPKQKPENKNDTEKKRYLYNLEQME